MEIMIRPDTRASGPGLRSLEEVQWPRHWQRVPASLARSATRSPPSTPSGIRRATAFAYDARPGVLRRFAVMIDEAGPPRRGRRLLHAVNLGATAIGTGLNAPAGYAESATRHLAARPPGCRWSPPPDLVEATQDAGGVRQHVGRAEAGGGAGSRRRATTCGCSRPRLRAGLNEIHLPAVQAGSSIMPGKVNPVIPEVVSQVCLRGHRLRRHGHDGGRAGPARAQLASSRSSYDSAARRP